MAKARLTLIKNFERIAASGGDQTFDLHDNDYHLHCNTFIIDAQKTVGLVLNNEVVAFQFHERPQMVLSQLGYGLCDAHFNRFWANPVDATREWHIALKNYEEVRAERSRRGINFAALAFQMARISILRCDDTARNLAYFSATVLLLIDEFEAIGETRGACAVLLEALMIFSDLEDVSYRLDRDYDRLSADLVAESRLIHERYNKANHLRLVWSNPLKLDSIC